MADKKKNSWPGSFQCPHIIRISSKETEGRDSLPYGWVGLEAENRS
jgi:hypothetical protein